MKAKDLLKSTTSCREKYHVTLKIDVSHTDHSLLIGKNGCGHKFIGSRTSTNIHFPDSNINKAVATLPVEKSNQVSISGNCCGGLEEARFMLRERQQLSVMFEISENLRHKLAQQSNEGGFEWIDRSIQFRTLADKFSVQVCSSRRDPRHLFIKGSVQTAEATLCASLHMAYLLAQIEGSAQLHTACLFVEVDQRHHNRLKREQRHPNCVDNLEKTLIKNFGAGVHITWPSCSSDTTQQQKRWSTTIELRGAVLDVFCARQYIIDCLPVELSFELSKESDSDILSTGVHVDTQLEKMSVHLRVPRSFHRCSTTTLAVNVRSHVIESRVAATWFSGGTVVLVTNEAQVTNLYRARCLLMRIPLDSPSASVDARPGVRVSDKLQHKAVQFQSALLQQHHFKSLQLSIAPTLLPSNIYDWGMHYQQYQQKQNPNEQVQSIYSQKNQESVHPALLEELSVPVHELDGQVISSDLNNIQTFASMQLSPSTSISSTDALIHANDAVNQRSWSSSFLEASKAVGSGIFHRAPGAERRLITNCANNEVNTGRAEFSESISYTSARRAMAELAEDRPHSRVPDNRFSGALFSYSMPTRTLRHAGKMEQASSSSLLNARTSSGTPDFVQRKHHTASRLFNNSCYEAKITHLLPALQYSQAQRQQQQRVCNNVELTDLLIKHQLYDIVDIITQQEIDLETFVTLTEDDLRELGVNKLGTRKKIMLLIRNLNTSSK